MGQAGRGRGAREGRARAGPLRRTRKAGREEESADERARGHERHPAPGPRGGLRAAPALVAPGASPRRAGRRAVRRAVHSDPQPRPPGPRGGPLRALLRLQLPHHPLPHGPLHRALLLPPPALAAPRAGGRGALRAGPPGGVPPGAVLRHAPPGERRRQLHPRLRRLAVGAGPARRPLERRPLRPAPARRAVQAEGDAPDPALPAQHPRPGLRAGLDVRPHPQRGHGLAGAQPHPGAPRGPPRLRDVRGHVGPPRAVRRPALRRRPLRRPPLHRRAGDLPPVRAPGLPLPGGARPRAGPVRRPGHPGRPLAGAPPGQAGGDGAGPSTPWCCT